DLRLSCSKRNQRTIRRNRPSESVVSKLRRYSAGDRNCPDAADNRARFIPLLCVGTNINQHPGAVVKPGPYFPMHARIFRYLRLRNETSLASVNDLEVQPPRVDVGQVFAVRGNRTTGDGIFA